MHPLAPHVGAGRLPDLERLGIVAKVDADLLEDGIGIALEKTQALLGQHLVVGDLAGDVREPRRRARAAREARFASRPLGRRA